jgi:hypothetical protein
MHAQLKHQLNTGTALGTGRDTSSHPWRTSRRNGVVTVERAARNGSSRTVSPAELEAREARNVSICEAWRSTTLSASEIAAQVAVAHPECTRNVVIGVVHRAGVQRGDPVARPVRPLAHEVRDRYLTRFLKAGWAVIETAEAFGLTEDTVRGVLRRCRKEGTLPIGRVVLATRATAPEAATTVVCVPITRATLLDASVGQCRSLHDDGTCCSAPVVHGRSWCSSHLALYTQPARRRAVA